MPDQEVVDKPEAAVDPAGAVQPEPAPGAPAPDAATVADVDAAAGPEATDAGSQPQAEADPRPENGAPYDFSRPWTVSNKFHHNLTSIAESYANQLSFSFSNYIRTAVDVTLKTVKQELFKDHLDSLPEKTCIGIFSIQPLKGQSVITVDADIMFVIMEKLIGGPGAAREVGREFTEIETRVFMVVLEKMLADLRDAARKFFDAREQLSRIENSAAFVAVMTPAERVMTISLNMNVGETEGSIRVAMPMTGFDPVMAQLDPTDEGLLERSDIPPEDLERIHGVLEDTHVEVAAVLGSNRITLDRLLNLEVGDTVVLAHRVNEPVPLMAGRVTLAHGEPGKSQNSRALRLVSSTKTEVRR